MKHIYTLFFFLVVSNSFFAQIDTKERSELIKSERNAASRSALDVNINPNTLNYDVRYVRLELDLDPNQQYISGTVTSHFKMLSGSSNIYFDLVKNLEVSEVKYHGQKINFQQLDTNELKINFPTTLAAQTTDSLSIVYSGIPDPYSDSFSASYTPDGDPVLATLSEPFGAKEWWPTKQSMNDKIEKMDIKITTPAIYNVASNGKLISETILQDGRKQTYWQTNYPIAAYLFALGISNYTKLNSVITTNLSSFPFVNYLYPSTAENVSVKNSLAWTTNCMDNFEKHFGAYPFRNEKYGHMQFNWGGGMEHQTMSSMIGFGQNLICHELAHQWFGDNLTCGSWNDIWLNEGFATFGEHLTYEKLLMSPTQFQNYLANEIKTITSEAGGKVYIPDSDLNFNRIFSSRLSYSKGGFVLRMIKWILGEDQFYAMLKAYQNNPNFVNNYVKTKDFMDFIKSNTGKDFTEFFNDWIFGEGYPVYQIRWGQNSQTKKVTFSVKQNSSINTAGFFELPLPIKVTGAGGKTAYLVLDNTTNNQSFTKDVDFDITGVSFNYENQIITKGSTVTKDNTLASEDIHQKSVVAVYPNPAKSFIKVSGLEREASYEIFSANGELVKKGIADKDSQISVASLPKAVYILKFNQQTIKFIKE